MKKANLILAAALAAAGVTSASLALITPSTAIAAEEKKTEAGKIGAKMRKPLAAAQEAINAKNWDDAQVHLTEAAAIQPQTPYETFMVDELGWYVQVQRKDYAGAATTLERAVASGFVPAADLPRRYKALAQLNYENKNYPKAAEYGKKALELTPDAVDTGTLTAHALFMADDFAGARALAEKLTTGAAKPDEQLLLIRLRSSYELDDKPGTVAALESLVRYYPQPKYWTDLLMNHLYETTAERDLRALYRLMSDTKALTRPEEYLEMASMLMAGGYPNEARQTLEAGMAASVFKGSELTRAQGELQRARSAADADAKELATADQALAAAKTGNAMVGIGKLYFSVGNYAKAADAFRQGLAKGGVSDTDDANMLLGIALVRGGKGAEAAQPLGQVRDPKLAGIARLWRLYVDTQTPAAPTNVNAG